MRKFLLSLVFISLASFYILYLGPCQYLGPNIGLSIGYYGRFNRVKNKLEQIPEIQIVNESANKDLFLEEFYFTVQTKNNLQINLAFWDWGGYWDDELFDKAGGFCVGTDASSEVLLYPMTHGDRFEKETGNKLRNAVDILKNIDRIIELIEIDIQNNKDGVKWDDVPKDYLWIFYHEKKQHAN